MDSLGNHTERLGISNREPPVTDKEDFKMSIKSTTARLGALAVAVSFLAAAPAQAVPTVVTSLADFNVAIGGASTTTDPFDNAIPGGVFISFDSGIDSTLAGGNLGFALVDNRVFDGNFDGGVDGNGSGGALTLTWDFPFPVIGFAFDIFGAAFVDVTIVGSGTFFDISTEIGGLNGFFGIVDAVTPFSAVEFSLQNSSSFDSFEVDNLVFARAPAAVPEPATLALFGAGLLGMGFLRRRRKTS